MERLWSGAGCAKNPDFEFVKYSDSGVPLYRKIAEGDVRLDEPGATFIVKRGAAPQEEASMSTLTETILKALKADPSDSEREAGRKAVVRKQMEAGVLKAENFAAELIIEAKAREIAKRDGCSYEQGYVKVLDDESNRDLVAALVA